MKVLITGAAGFLGSHLMLYHLKQGDAVLGIDNFCSSEPNSDHVKLIRLLCSTHGKRGMLVEGDITENGDDGLWGCFAEFESGGLGNRFDIIYNFACPASPPRYQEMPILTMMTCVAGTGAVLDMAEKHRAIVVHASTSEVYGDPEHTPQQESYRGRVNSYGPRACYDEGKRAAEALCYDYLNTYEVDVRLVRIFNTYGPHMDPHDGRVVSNFICQALRGEPMTVYGDGKQSRSFCYVDDLIRGIVAVGALGQNPRGPINLGNPNEFTVGDLALAVAEKIYDGAGIIRYEKLPVDDPTQRCPDISRAKELLDWEPKVQLGEGLDRTIEYFKSAVKQF
jgi:UDP-glucuronate decarboxylase